jgi:hypothetical protein
VLPTTAQDTVVHVHGKAPVNVHTLGQISDGFSLRSNGDGATKLCAVCRKEICKPFQQCAFPCAIGTDYGGEGARFKMTADVLQSQVLSIAYAHLVQFNHRPGHSFKAQSTPIHRKTRAGETAATRTLTGQAHTLLTVFAAPTAADGRGTAAALVVSVWGEKSDIMQLNCDKV